MTLVMADYDGTWDQHPEIRGSVSAVITGTSWEDYQDVMDSWEGKRVPVFFNPIRKGKEELLNICQHKADIINKTGATDYYENQPQQAQMLKILCPNTRIHLVHTEETSI